MTALADTARRLRAALYGRVSHDKSGKGRSVLEQEDESRADCGDRNWDVQAVYAEDGAVSASRFSKKLRPAWAQLVEDLQAGLFDVVVLWETSRGSRRLTGWSELLDACRAKGVLIHVTSHQRTYDMKNSRDWKTLAEEGIDAAMASEETSARVKRSARANARAGRPHGMVPYGYVRRYDPATKALVAQEIDPATAPVIREIFQRLAAAEPVSAVTRDFNARGIQSPWAGRKIKQVGDGYQVKTQVSGRWERQQVRDLALSYTYVAKRNYQGEILGGNWPAIVEEDVWYAVRSVLLDPKRLITKPGRNRYLLSYIARCDECDERLSASPRTGKTSTYSCRNGHASCGVPWLDRIITPLVLGHLKNPELVARLAGGNDKAALAARIEAAALQERLDGFRDAAAAGDLSPASLAHVEARLVTDIAAAQKRAAAAAMPSVLRGLAGVDDIDARWEALSIAGRRKIISTLLEVRLSRAMTRGVAARTDFDRVHVTWKELP